MNYRFPSSAPARAVAGGEKGGGGAIVHLLSAPNQVPSAMTGGFPTPIGRTNTLDRGRPTAELRLHNEVLIKAARRAVRTVKMVFGYDVEPEEDEEPIRTWGAHDALHMISEQTRVFVEEEFRTVFNPRDTSGWVAVDVNAMDDSGPSGFDLEPVDEGVREKEEEEEENIRIPVLSISSP